MGCAWAACKSCRGGGAGRRGPRPGGRGAGCWHLGHVDPVPWGRARQKGSAAGEPGALSRGDSPKGIGRVEPGGEGEALRGLGGTESQRHRGDLCAAYCSAAKSSLPRGGLRLELPRASVLGWRALPARTLQWL